MSEDSQRSNTAGSPSPSPRLETVRFDLESLTLGEVIAAEDASGLDISRLLATAGHRRALGVFVSLLRSSEKPPQWQELMNLRLVDVSPGR